MESVSFEHECGTGFTNHFWFAKQRCVESQCARQVLHWIDIIKVEWFDARFLLWQVVVQTPAVGLVAELPFVAFLFEELAN